MSSQTPRVGSGLLGLDDTEREWVTAKWAIIRDAQINSDRAVGEWRRLNAEIMDYLARSNVTDIKQVANIKGESLPLKDAFARGQWWAEHARRHIDDVQLFLRLKELDLL